MNDLKTLYDACSDNDELAQIAEKLGIGDANLSTILNKIIDAIPEGGGGIEPIILRYKVQLQEENSPIITPDASNPQFSEIEEAFEANKPFFVIQQTITTDGATINASGFVVPQYDDMGGEYKFPSLYKGVDISF